MSNESVSVERLEDMSPDGNLTITFQADGDVLLRVRETQENPICRLPGVADIEFCTHAGGGKSPRTLKALRELAKAMWLDNMEDATRRGSICEDIRPWFPKGAFDGQ